MNTGLLINKLSNCLRRRSGEIQRSVGITGAQGAILDFIIAESAADEVCQRDIEKEFGLRPSTATEVLQSLEAVGLIRRVPSARDARIKNIEFTPQAGGIRAVLKGEINDTERLLLKGITPAEHELFMAVGAKMLRNMSGE